MHLSISVDSVEHYLVLWLWPESQSWCCACTRSQSQGPCVCLVFLALSLRRSHHRGRLRRWANVSCSFHGEWWKVSSPQWYCRCWQPCCTWSWCSPARWPFLAGDRTCDLPKYRPVRLASYPNVSEVCLHVAYTTCICYQHLFWGCFFADSECRVPNLLMLWEFFLSHLSVAQRFAPTQKFSWT